MKKTTNETTQEITDVDFKIIQKGPAKAVQQAVGQGRKNRFEAPEQRWEEIEAIYQAAARGVVETGRNVNVALNVPGVREHITNPAEVNVLMKGLEKDLTTFSGVLTKIHGQHAGKSGVVQGETDQRLCLSVFDEYVNFETQFKAVTLPTVIGIMDHIGAACSAMTEKFEKEQSIKAMSAEDAFMDAAGTETIVTSLPISDTTTGQ